MPRRSFADELKQIEGLKAAEFVPRLATSPVSNPLPNWKLSKLLVAADCPAVCGPGHCDRALSVGEHATYTHAN